MENIFQSKSVPRGTRTIWRYLSAFILFFSLSIGQMWGAAELTLSTTASGAAFGDWNKSYTNVVVTTVGPSAFGSKKACGVSSNVATCSLSSADSYYLEISLTSAAASSYTLDKVVLRVAGNNTGTTDYTAPLFYSNEATFDDHKVEGVMDIHYTGYDQSCDDNEYSFPVGTKSCRLYRRAKWTAPAGETKGIVGTGSNYSCSNQTMHITYMEVYLKPSCTKPGTPGTPSVNSKTHNSANLTWTAADNSDGYKISIVKKLDASVIVDWTDCATNSYAASGLSPETTYTFKVKAKGASGYCDLGDEASADFATEADPSATTYKVTLIPAGGAISDATGWTLNAGNYEKEVSSGAELTLPTFTKANRTFKTWRKSGPTDVTSPITVTTDVTLTAVWTATVEQVLYSWEGGSPATEVGGTAVTKAQDGSDAETSDINVDAIGTNATYKAIKVQGKISSNAWSGNYIQITTDEAVKTGDKVKITACTTKGDTSKKGSAQIRVGTSATGTQIVSDGGTYNDIAVASDVPVPNTKTFTITATEINTNLLSMTRQSTNTNCWVTKLQIIRETQVEEGDLLTVTFNSNGGSEVAAVAVASGQAVAKPADPTKAHNRFNEWQLSGSAYNFSTPVTSSITLDATWTPLYTVTYAANGGSGEMADANEYAAGDEVTLKANEFSAPDASHVWDSWAVTDGSSNPVAVSEGKFSMPSSNATVTAQWALISDFDVMFFQGFGEVDVQIGETQTISTGNYATAPAPDPTRSGYRFLGWSYDATAEHIVNVSEYAITAATNFTAMWIQQFAVTFDGAGEVLVDNGATVASPNSPVTAGKVFQGWYNGESKYDFSAAVTENLALESKWMDADPNHFFYFYKDAFHYDGVVYKTPEGKVDEGAGESNVAITTPYTLFSGEGGITSIVANNAIYDSKSNWVNAYLKLNTSASSNLVFTIKSGFSAVLYMKMGGYSDVPTVTLVDAGNNPVAMTGTISGRASDENGFAQVSFNLVAGTYTLTTTVKTLYISDIELIATVIPAHTVTYKAGEGTGDDVVDADATQVADVPGSFTAPEGKIFHGWKDALNNDVAVGEIVENDMELTAQWIGHYAVTFNMQGHGASIVAQDIVHGSKAVKPADPVAIGWEFGGWFTEAACENEFDFNTAITAATPLFAKWTEFDGCTLLYPATSGSALSVGDNVDVQTGSKGGNIAIVGMKEAGSIAYHERGLQMGGGSADVISVTLNNDMDIDTKISVTLDAKSGSRPRGLYLLNGAGGSVKGGTLLGWNTPGDAVTEGEIETFSYTVEDADGLAGTNVFRLKRQNSTYIKCIKVESCGAAITYHNLTSEVNIAGKGTVALGATSVREGYTTTAEYTITDPLYEFVNWTVSGAGASVENATANPATITVGTEDAVVTLNLRLIPVKFTVNYYDGETPMGTELVPVNEHPTASEINTNKRHFTFQGWAETDGGSVVDLNTITRTEATTVNLYAVYAPVACPTSGTIFSMEFDDAKRPSSTVKVAKAGGTLDLSEYAIISGGAAIIKNTETSDKDAISTDGKFKLTATKEVMKIELECVLQEGDIIRVPDNNAKYVISTSDSKTGTYQAQTSSQHEFAVTADWAGVDDIYVLYDGTSLSFTQIEVYRRPALTGASLADLTIRQGVIKTPELTLEPSADAIVTSQVWEIVGTPVNLTGAAIDAATGAITTGTLDDASLNGTITVKVTLNGSIEATCTATVVDAVVQQNVTKSTIWNWQKTGATANIELTNSTDPKRNEAFVLANVAVNNDADFESDKLVVEGQYMVRDYDKPNPYFQGQTIKFNTTLPGVVRVKFSNTGGNPARELYINGVGTGNSSANATLNWSDYVEVPVGEVSMTAFYVDPAEGTGQQYIRVAEIEFLALAHQRTSGYNAGDLGTVCLEDATIIDGANLYKLAGLEEHGYLAFDEISSGELEAGKPYLFEVTNPSKISFYKQVGAAHSDDEIATNGMIGTFTGTTLKQGDNNYYYFSGRHIWRVNDFTVDIPLAAHRCYVDMDVLLATPAPSAPAPGRRRVLLGVNGEQVATGMENVESDNVQSTKLLINGQLFILRGEKIYDATGRLVK